MDRPSASWVIRVLAASRIASSSEDAKGPLPADLCQRPEKFTELVNIAILWTGQDFQDPSLSQPCPSSLRGQEMHTLGAQVVLMVNSSSLRHDGDAGLGVEIPNVTPVGLKSRALRRGLVGEGWLRHQARLGHGVEVPSSGGASRRWRMMPRLPWRYPQQVEHRGDGGRSHFRRRALSHDVAHAGAPHARVHTGAARGTGGDDGRCHFHRRSVAHAAACAGSPRPCVRRRDGGDGGSMCTLEFIGP